MMVRTAVVLMALGAGAALGAQTTGPSFNAPYRAFTSHEFGATMAFPRPGGTQIEGQYRFGSGTFDVGMRGGIFFPGGAADEAFVVGVEARSRVLTHSETFPLDGALVFGVGAQINGGTLWRFPVGLSLGRRLTIEGSDISIIPYVQPTGFLAASGGNTDFLFALGLGADFRLSSVFDARLSIGLGDVEGLAISAVWVR